MTMHHCDLRLGLFDEDDNTTTAYATTVVESKAELLSSVRSADIIVFQFVLHENASFLVHKETGLFVGATESILSDRGAKEGTFLICTDSGHRLWPALKKTAALHGWEFFGDAENDHKISLGPKSFVILEKMRRASSIS